MIVFDEATSSLDALTEKTIMSSLREASSNRTALFVAHRLSTIKDADMICVMDGGRVVEKGTHQELLSNPSSMYSNLWLSQHSAGYRTHSELLKEKKKKDEELLFLDADKCCGSSSCNR